MISQMFFFFWFCFLFFVNHDGQTHPDLQHQSDQPCIPFILLALSESLCFDLILKKTLNVFVEVASFTLQTAN